MEINTVYSIIETQDNCLMIDMDLMGEEGSTRIVYAYRSSDPYSPLTLLITQWLLDNPDQEILPYVPPAEPTPEELRAKMPDKTPREFRDIMIDEGVLTDTVPDEVTVAIQQIPFDKERTKALNAWQNPTMFSRSDPYIDMIGAMFGYTPEDIDRLWIGDNEQN